MFYDTVGQIRLAEQIMIPRGNISQVWVRLHILNVGFHDWPEAFYGGYFVSLAGDDAIDGLIYRLHARTGNSGLRVSLSGSLPGLSKSRAGHSATQKYRKAKILRCLHIYSVN